MPFTPVRRQLFKTSSALLLASMLAGCGGGSDDDPVVVAVAPGLTITSDAPGNATGPFTLSFSFSAAVSDFATNRILISGGFLNGAALVKVSDTVYTLVVTPTPGKTGVAEITVQAGAFKDASGATASSRAYGFSQAYDTLVVSTEPLLSISHDLASGTATGPITFTLIFSEDVGASFTVGSLTVSGGTISSFVKDTSTRYTMVVTPPSATTGFVLLVIDAGKFSSLAGVPSNQQYSTAVFYTTP